MPGVSRPLSGNRRVNLKEPPANPAGGPLCYQSARRAATGKARVYVIRGLMLVLRGGDAVFLFGYFHETHRGAPGASEAVGLKSSANIAGLG